jgi:putative transposase
MEELVEFIQSNPDSRELKRALAVQMVLKGYLYRQIAEILSVSDSFISKWWLVFESVGVIGLQLSYQGSKGYLNAGQRQAVINWLQQKNYWNLTQLQQHIQDRYSIKFKSRQSYYELFALSGISWKKTQKRNPKKDPELVQKKTRNTCPTESMAARDSSRKNECIFPG